MARIADLFPQMTIIAAHMGGMSTPEEADAFLVGKPNVYLDTAFISHFLTPEQAAPMMRRHGLDRILFASDSPWSRSCDELDFLQQCGFTSSELELILGENARRLLKISKSDL